jgi:alkylation response protein AidB-like acyl-CoA dehydrogenase
MDLADDPKLAALRDEIRQWFAENLPEDIRRRVFNGEKIPKSEQIPWMRKVAEKGWLAPSWPKEWGGPGWGPAERFLFDEEANIACMPKATMNIPGLDLLGPVIAEFGTPEQKERFLPAMLRADHWWGQGFSEPNAGSDLANLSTRAVREGDEYVVNGTKLWTSHAQDSNWLFALVRTSIEPKKQAGISFLLIDMDQPGVTVSPIITIGGVHAVNEVRLEEAGAPPGRSPNSCWGTSGWSAP